MEKPRIRLNTRDLMIVSMHSAGIRLREIAAACGVSVSTVSTVVRKARMIVERAAQHPEYVTLGFGADAVIYPKLHASPPADAPIDLSGFVVTLRQPPATPRRRNKRRQRRT